MAKVESLVPIDDLERMAAEVSSKRTSLVEMLRDQLRLHEEAIPRIRLMLTRFDSGPQSEAAE